MQPPIGTTGSRFSRSFLLLATKRCVIPTFSIQIRRSSTGAFTSWKHLCFWVTILNCVPVFPRKTTVKLRNGTRRRVDMVYWIRDGFFNQYFTARNPTRDGCTTSHHYSFVIGSRSDNIVHTAFFNFNFCILRSQDNTYSVRSPWRLIFYLT